MGDACHFYPRVTRRAGDMLLMTAALSCPEAARLALFSETPFTLVDSNITRSSELLRNYHVDGMNSDMMLRIHQAFLECAGGDSNTVEDAVMRLLIVADAFAYLPVQSWVDAVGFYFRSADARMPEAELQANDPFSLFQIFAVLIKAVKKSPRTRLNSVLQRLMQQLHITLDEQTLELTLSDDSAAQYRAMADFWKIHVQQEIAPLLRRYIQAQLSVSFFPFSGLGQTLTERMTIIAIRFATVRLALMTLAFEQQRVPTQAECIDIIQPISRFLDHLADAEFSLALFKEAGWTNLARLRSVVGYY